VRSLTQDDAHVFLRPDQIQEEFNRAIDLTLEVFNTYGLTDYWIALSLRDPNKKEDYVGSDETWERAESALRQAVNNKGIRYREMIGEAAFYGPKRTSWCAMRLAATGSAQRYSSTLCSLRTLSLSTSAKTASLIAPSSSTVP